MAKSLSRAQQKIVELEQKIQTLSTENYLLRQEKLRTTKEQADSINENFESIKSKLSEKWNEIEEIILEGFQCPHHCLQEEGPILAVTTRKVRGSRIQSEIHGKFGDNPGFRQLMNQENIIEELSELPELPELPEASPEQLLEASPEQLPDELLEESLESPKELSENIASHRENKGLHKLMDKVPEVSDVPSGVLSPIEASHEEVAKSSQNEPIKNTAENLSNNYVPSPQRSPEKSEIQVFVDQTLSPLPAKGRRPNKKSKILKPKENIPDTVDAVLTPIKSQISENNTNRVLSRRRSSRTGSINYAEPSLKVKMRRQSSNLIDAIGQENEAPKKRRRLT